MNDKVAYKNILRCTKKVVIINLGKYLFFCGATALIGPRPPYC
jgi:hypothetical protein